VKGVGKMLGYPISTPSKSASFGVGLESLEVGQDGTNSTSFFAPWYNAILKILPLNWHTIYFDIWKQTFNPKKHLYQVNLKTQENCQRDTIFTSLKLNATLINPLKLN
jgi:hypothetical protein